MSSWKRNPSRAIKFKTTASGIGSFELHILEAWWVSWRQTTTGLPCSCTCSSAPVSGHGWEGLLSQEVSLCLLCKTKWTSIWSPSVPKAKMLLVAHTFPTQSWLHYSTSAMEQAGWEELVEVLQRRAKAWSRTVLQKAVYTAWEPSLVSCCGAVQSWWGLSSWVQVGSESTSFREAIPPEGIE